MVHFFQVFHYLGLILLIFLNSLIFARALSFGQFRKLYIVVEFTETLLYELGLMVDLFDELEVVLIALVMGVVIKIVRKMIHAAMF